MEIHFAPLQGYTEAVYRNAHAEIFGGADAYYTPFVRQEKGEFRNKDIREINVANNNVPRLIPQLIATNRDEAETIIHFFTAQGYKEIDLNMGCPFPLITKTGKGCGILPHPERVADIVSIIEEYPELSFSIKMRLGMESVEEAVALLPLLNRTRLKHITLHPRTGRQQYKGICDKEAFARFAKACEHPLIYNGDITSAQQALELKNEFPFLKGIMIGRGLLSNPALATEIKTGEALSEKELYHKVHQLHETIFTHYQSCLHGEAQLMSKLKPIWDYLLPNAEKRLRKRVCKANKTEAYLHAVKELLL